MAIFRGTGGQGDSTTDTTITVVTQKAADAAASASAAASSASSASGSATNAATSATNAATSEANAATSETNAATSETNASASETNAATSETNAATSATNAETSKVAAQAAQTAAELAETNAETAETNAQASATTATTKAGEASTSAATATTQAGIATTKASEASSSATDAQTAQTAAELKLDQFDDRYLGSKTSDPTLDNDGNALLTGALYWNSTSDLLKIYTGSAWVRVISEVSQDTTPQLGGELDGQTNKITNIGDPTSAQDAATKTYVDSQVQSKDALSELSGDSDDITEGSTNLFLTTTERTKLSGIEASATADQTASEILTAIKTVDGSGSGLDADLLDGNEASAFATSAQGSTADSALQNISEDTTPQLGGNLNTNGNDIIFGDDDQARFGTGGGAAGGSLLISATATESTIAETGSGDLTVKADTFKVTNANGLEDMLIATPDAGVELYHNDVKKFETTSNGAEVTGNLNTTTILASGDILTFTNIQVGGTVDGRDVATDGTKLDGIEASADVTDATNVTAAGALMDSEVTNLAQVKAFDSSDYATAAQGTTADNALPTAGGTLTGDLAFGDNVKAKFGAGDDLQIYHDGSDSYLADLGTGNLKLLAGSLRIRNGADTADLIEANNGGAVRLYHNNSAKLATTSTGIDVTGSIVSEIAINAQTGTTYTLVLGDQCQLVTLDNASAVTVTIPPNSSVAYPTGTKIDLLAKGAGQVTVAEGSGVTVNSAQSLKLRAQWSAASAIKLATDTWVLVGDLQAI